MVTPDEMGRDGYRWGEPGTPFGTRYWDQDGRVVTDNLEGDDSRVIVDRAVPFMEKGVDNDTMVWFCSDNGPEGSEDLAGNGRNRGTTGGLRGRKRSLFNGGIGVPSLLKWPARVAAGAEYHMPCSTLDYFPTIASALSYTMPDQRPLDGTSLLPLIDGRARQRSRPIPYRFLESQAAMFGAPTLALIEDRFKFLTNLSADGAEDVLFDIDADMAETADIAAREPERARHMRQHLSDFISSCQRSHAGGDYPGPYTPVNDFQEITGTWR